MDVLNYYGVDFNHNKALCPFHNDNNPSFVVNKEKKIATCFSCGVKGNVISFVQKYEKLVNNNDISVNDAIKKVVEICNLNIDVSHLNKMQNNYQYTVASRKYSKEEITLLEVNKKLNKLWSYNLRNNPSNKSMEYLMNRGLTEEVIKELNLGCAEKGQLLKISEKDELLSKDNLIKLGYLRFNDKGELYETFQDRVMIPICDEKNNIVSFCGRTMEVDVKPKYLHTIETPIFQKKELLYNYNNSKVLAYNNELILVEGYMDVIGAKLKGFDNVSALMGVFLSAEQLNLIRMNRSSITLALDNDDAGKKAMLNIISELIKKNIQINVLDISKLGEYKDFGDIINTNLSFEDIQKCKTSGFEFLLEKEYFNEENLNVSNIYNIFQKLKEDELINNTYDESLFREYMRNNTDFTKKELDDILYPKNLDNPIEGFTNKATSNYLYIQLKQEVEKTNDKVLMDYFNKNRLSIQNLAVDLFNSDISKYIEESTTNLKADILLKDLLKDNKDYSLYESLNRFTHINVFDKTYIKNNKGSARIKLSEQQKEIVIKQFENSLSNEEKLSLEEVEELYIVNSIDDIDGILSISHNSMKIFRDNIKDRMFLNSGKMDFFKYGNLFHNINKEFIDNSFKGKSGDFKTILFYNNLDNSLDLSKNNVMSKDEIEEIEHEEQTIKELEKDYLFSINHILLVPTKETDTHYFVRIPGTKATEYFYIPKIECQWSENHEILFSKLKSNQTYPIYDVNGQYIKDKSFKTLKSYWEDKTNKKNAIEEEKQLKPHTKKTFIYENSFESKFKEPFSKIYYTNTEETTKGFYIKTNNPNQLLFVVKKLCQWSDNHKYLIITPKKSRLFDTGISLYELKGFKKKHLKKVSYEEVEKYMDIIYPVKRSQNNLCISIPKTNCEFSNNFINIPLYVNESFGYIEINIVKSRVTEDTVELKFNPDELMSFHNNEDNTIIQYSGLEVFNAYNEMQEKNNYYYSKYNSGFINKNEKEVV